MLNLPICTNEHKVCTKNTLLVINLITNPNLCRFYYVCPNQQISYYISNNR